MNGESRQQQPGIYKYPLEYSPKRVGEQVQILKELFPVLCEAHWDANIAGENLPDGAEAYFAIPRWEKIALTYNEALKKVLVMITNTRKDKFLGWSSNQLGPSYLREHEWTVAAWKRFGERQKECDILVVPAQFGLRHSSRSAQFVRKLFSEKEFALGAFAVGIMLLVHPERLVRREDLFIDCAGDEFSSGANNRFEFMPYFCFNKKVEPDSLDLDETRKCSCHQDDEGVGFDMFWNDFARDVSGSASGFLIE